MQSPAGTCCCRRTPRLGAPRSAWPPALGEDLGAPLRGSWRSRGPCGPTVTVAAHKAVRGCRRPVPSPPCAPRTSGHVGQGQGRPCVASGVLVGPGAWTRAVFPPLDSFSPFGVTSLAAPAPSFTRGTGILRKQHPGDCRALTLPEAQARGRAEGAGQRPGGAGEPAAVGPRELSAGHPGPLRPGTRPGCSGSPAVWTRPTQGSRPPRRVGEDPVGLGEVPWPRRLCESSLPGDAFLTSLSPGFNRLRKREPRDFSFFFFLNPQKPLKTQKSNSTNKPFYLLGSC